MQNRDLSADHLRRATARLSALDALYEARSWADVVRESQEVVELALKGLLRAHGVEPPRIHDVADVLLAEQAFDGAEDLTPSDFYKEPDAVSAHDGARFVVTTVRPFVR